MLKSRDWAERKCNVKVEGLSKPNFTGESRRTKSYVVVKWNESQETVAWHIARRTNIIKVKSEFESNVEMKLWNKNQAVRQHKCKL